MPTRTMPPLIHSKRSRTDCHSPSAKNAGRNNRSSPTDWHTRSVKNVLEQLNTTKAGLSPKEALTRLKSHGPNRLDAAPRRGVIARFLAQFNNVLLYVLIGAAVMTGLLGHWVDTGVIVGVVLMRSRPATGGRRTISGRLRTPALRSLHPGSGRP